MEYSAYLTTMAQVEGVLVGFANLANAISRPGMSIISFYPVAFSVTRSSQETCFFLIACRYGRNKHKT